MKSDFLFIYINTVAANQLTQDGCIPLDMGSAFWTTSALKSAITSQIFVRLKGQHWCLTEARMLGQVIFY